jgi:hypothetical protein
MKNEVKKCSKCIFWQQYSHMRKYQIGRCDFINEYCINLPEPEIKVQGIGIMKYGEYYQEIGGLVLNSTLNVKTKAIVFTHKDWYCKGHTGKGGNEILKNI